MAGMIFATDATIASTPLGLCAGGAAHQHEER
jgi:hypothetical protein